ncbi:MAG: metal ABC transporter ATP-binding protein [Actinobacteria bacterium]|jgi:ABC-type Mn2+/Zn2+ transport system ATPase subunit|nr:metal ABC transporter ATP-binding protein [Actinomycetota bacterium]
MNELLEVRDVSVVYGERTVLDSVSLVIPHGAQIAVVGPNGAGKSTLFKAMMGLVPLRHGEMLIHGRPASEYRDPVAYVPQREEVDWHFPVTVWDVVSMGRYGRGRWLRKRCASDLEIIRRSMDSLGISALAERPIGELSGGQQQRVFLARALAQEPHVLLLDEPFTGVDISTKEAVLEFLSSLRDRVVTVLVSTHDLELASARFDEIVLLNGRLISSGSPEQVFTEAHLQAAFGGQMVVVNGRVIAVDQCCGGGAHDAHGPTHNGTL